jgi:hypothetical protein
MVINLQVLTNRTISAVCTSITKMPMDDSQAAFSYSYIVTCILVLADSRYWQIFALAENQMRITMVISLQVLTDSGISTVRTSLTEMPKDSSRVVFSYSYIVACILILTKFPLIPTSTDICLS